MYFKMHVVLRNLSPVAMQQGFRMGEKHVVVWIYLSTKHVFVLKLFYT